MSANLQKKVDGVEKRTDSLENILGQFISSMNSTMIRMESRYKSAEERDENIKKGDKQKMGRACQQDGDPGGGHYRPEHTWHRGRIFRRQISHFFGIRIRKLIGDDLSHQREFDVVAVSEKKFYINETKSRPRTEDVRDFVSVLEELPDYFPECRGRKVIPVFSSLYIPEEIVIHLSRNGICAMAMREDTMDLLNFDEVVGK